MHARYLCTRDDFLFVKGDLRKQTRCIRSGVAKVSDLDKVCSPGTEADNVEFGAAILCLEEQVPAKVPDKHGLYAVWAKASYDNSVRCCS